MLKAIYCTLLVAFGGAVFMFTAALANAHFVCKTSSEACGNAGLGAVIWFLPILPLGLAFLTTRLIKLKNELKGSRGTIVATLAVIAALIGLFWFLSSN